MSIIKNIQTYPSTLRDFIVNTNIFSQIIGCFLSLKGFIFTNETSFQDFGDWQDAMTAMNIFPLHHAFEFNPQDEDAVLGASKQDFTFKVTDGKYKHKISYIWSLAFYQIVENYSNSNLEIFYYDKNNNIYGTSDNGTAIRGFSTTRLILDKPNFSNSTTPSFSPLDVELSDATELTQRGVIKQMTWLPELVDKLYIYINVEYVAVDSLNFTAKYNGIDISTLGSSDVTVIDDANGTLTFTLFNYLGGAYQLSGFSSNLTTVCLQVNSALYLGETRCTLTSYAPYTANAVWGDGENEIWGDGENAIYGDHIS